MRVIGAGILGAIGLLNLLVLTCRAIPPGARDPSPAAQIRALEARVADLEAHAQAVGYHGLNIAQARAYQRDLAGMHAAYDQADQAMGSMGLPR